MKTILGVIIATTCTVSAPVSGHHSEAGIDLDSVLTFEATVTEFSWRNPHVHIAAETIDERGEPVEWALQMGSIVTATRTGWTRAAQYWLTEDGTRAVVDFMLEDPEYMAAPMTHSREMIYSPQMEMSRFNCDPEAARRFVPR
jgi:hypothetical protein